MAPPSGEPGRPRVILFGLSANPPTGAAGHVGIVRWAATQADEVWVLPVFRHAFHEKRDLAPFDDRVAMARLAFEAIPGLEGRVHVKLTERDVAQTMRIDEKVGTIDVVRRLRAERPDVDLVLLLGADTWRDLARGRWKESDALRALVPVVVVAREGVDVEPGAPTQRVPGLGAVSSSAVRSSRDRAYLAEVLPPRVLEYIEAHGLYGFAAPRSSRA
ncbi:nicotinate-nicotinamide nucleotide adenylyltransferase [Myxococcota bacterium]|nr:nicotinate-nicotinamide nucleotide adenylyltransferase [Myxococcota bacterium]